MFKRLFILSYEEAANFNPKDFGKTAIIRISSQEFKPLKYENEFSAVLKLNFLDIEEVDFYNFEYEEIENLKKNCPNPYPISTYQAEMIVDFVKKYLNSVDNFLIHCDEGISRSPAVGYFIAKIFFKDENLAEGILRDYFPNKTVISKLEGII